MNITFPKYLNCLALALFFKFGAGSVAADLTDVVAWGRGSEGQTNVPPGLSNVVTIAAGGYHSLAVKTDGTVLAWGINDFGQTSVPVDLTSVSLLAAGFYHDLAMKSNGTVVAWGRNDYGQGNVPSNLTGVVALAAGQFFSLALKNDGTLLAWGRSDPGQEIIAPAGLSNVVAIAAGYSHCLALKSSGKVVAWGNNVYGQTSVPADLENVVAIAAGGDHNLALRGDGTVVAWGINNAGQANVPAGLSHVVTIACNGQHSLARTEDGTVIAWGDNSSGQTSLPAGLSHVVAIAAGHAHSLALLQSGPPFFVGLPAQRTAYTGATVAMDARALGTPPLRYQWLFNDTLMPDATNSILILSNVQVSHSGRYIVAVSNEFGVATTTNTFLTVSASKPIITVQPISQSTYPGIPISFRVVAEGTEPIQYQWFLNGAEVIGATNAEIAMPRVSLDREGLYVVRVRNPLGETNTQSASLKIPRVVVSGYHTSYQPQCYYDRAFIPDDLPNDVVAVAGGYQHSMALRSNGRVLAWGGLVDPWCGSFDFGQTNPPPDLTNAVMIASGAKHCLALRNNGTVIAWGANGYGQSSVPVGLSNVVAIAAGEKHSLALKNDGAVVAWGSTAPTNVPPALGPVLAIAAGPSHSLALRADGTVAAWGNNFNRLGYTNVPAGLSNVVAVTAGRYHSMALKADGSVVRWGSTNSVPPLVTNIIAIASGTMLNSNGTVSGWYCINGPGAPDCPPPQLTNVVAIAAGLAHMLAIVGDVSIPPPVGVAPEFSNPIFTGQQFSISVPSLIGKVYVLEYKEALNEINWTALSLILGDGRMKVLTDPAAASPQRFYRVRQLR